MKKTFMKIMAAVLAVLIMAVAIPFGAGAALTSGNSYIFTLKCDKTDFGFTVYQLATIDTTTGDVTVTDGVADAVKTAIENGSSASAIISAADATESLGSVSDTFQPTDASTTKDFSTVPGYYYVKCTRMPQGASAASSLIVTQYENNAWVENAGTIDVGGKVGTVSLDKKIVENNKEVKYTSASVGETVTFKLKASVPSNVSEKLTEMTITDTMEAGLSATDVNIVSVKQGTADIKYSKVDVQDATFGIKIDSNVLTKDSFYQNGDVVVTFTTMVTPQATVGRDSNDNTVGIQYKTTGNVKTQQGPTVQVFTFNVEVIKVDSNSNKLQGAKFGLYSQRDCSDNSKLAEATTDRAGTTNFGGKQLKAGTYYVKELEAPKGYILDSTAYPVTIEPNYDTTGGTVTVRDYQANSDGKITVENIKISAPQTGGMGTMMFTIGGAALIAAAGVMFVMLKRKKTSK
ncbi:MAG: SpaH/EbpB family LPXTG-anchored major pilin [Oscillospiraceae bacterium]|nr:SpaH/EbpB family LPXTG-anchored major pilin [Oscillospiraceae bacterium]